MPIQVIIDQRQHIQQIFPQIREIRVPIIQAVHLPQVPLKHIHQETTQHRNTVALHIPQVKNPQFLMHRYKYHFF